MKLLISFLLFALLPPLLKGQVTRQGAAVVEILNYDKSETTYKGEGVEDYEKKRRFEKYYKKLCISSSSLNIRWRPIYIRSEIYKANWHYYYNQKHDHLKPTFGAGNFSSQKNEDQYARTMHEDLSSSDIMKGIGPQPYKDGDYEQSLYFHVKAKWKSYPGFCPTFVYTADGSLITPAFGRGYTNLLIVDPSKLRLDDIYSTEPTKKRGFKTIPIVKNAKQTLKSRIKNATDFITLPGRDLGLGQVLGKHKRLKNLRDTSGGAYIITNGESTYMPINVSTGKKKPDGKKEPAILIINHQRTNGNLQWSKSNIIAIRLTEYGDTLNGKIHAILLDSAGNLWFSLNSGIVGIIEKQQLDSLNKWYSKANFQDIRNLVTPKVPYHTYDLNEDTLVEFPEVESLVYAYLDTNNLFHPRLLSFIKTNKKQMDISDEDWVDNVRRKLKVPNARLELLLDTLIANGLFRRKLILELISMFKVMAHSGSDLNELAKLLHFKKVIVEYNKDLTDHPSKFDEQCITLISKKEDKKVARIVSKEKAGKAQEKLNAIRKELIQNSFSAAGDAVFIVSNLALYKFSFNGREIQIDPRWISNYSNSFHSYVAGSAWQFLGRTPFHEISPNLVYNNVHFTRSGQLNNGTGTTPTIFEFQNKKYITISDNDYPTVNLLVFDAENGECMGFHYAFLATRGSACENSVIAVTHKSTDPTINKVIPHIIIGNTFGFSDGFKNDNTTPGGFTKFEFNPGALDSDSPKAEEVLDVTEYADWPSNYDIKIATPKLANNGIIYLYNREYRSGVDGYANWALTAVSMLDGCKLFSLVPQTEIKSYKPRKDKIIYRKFGQLGILDRIAMKGGPLRQKIFNNMMATFTVGPNNILTVSGVRGFMVFPLE